MELEELHNYQALCDQELAVFNHLHQKEKATMYQARNSPLGRAFLRPRQVRTEQECVEAARKLYREWHDKYKELGYRVQGLGSYRRATGAGAAKRLADYEAQLAQVKAEFDAISPVSGEVMTNLILKSP